MEGTDIAEERLDRSHRGEPPCLDLLARVVRQSAFSVLLLLVRFKVSDCFCYKSAGDGARESAKPFGR
jgi:hypothetical protein